MAHKGQENLIPFNERTEEEQREIARKAGIASGEARREIGQMRRTLEKMLSKSNSKGMTYDDNIALGLIANAIDRKKGGNPRAYEVIAKMMREMDNEPEMKETPEVTINIVDISDLEKVLYEDSD